MFACYRCGRATMAEMTATPKPWMNASLPVSSRVALLLAAMTLDEKVAQLGYDINSCASLNASHFPHGIGGCGVGSADKGVNITNTMNAAMIRLTRLGVPISVHGETTHSGGALGTTVFPMPVLQGSSWNMTLIEEIARVNALQLRASGGDHALSPVLQVCTDPRFGRLEENFGEDPFLVSRCGVAAVRGLQGADGLGGAVSYLGSARERVVAQAKHFAMYGAAGKDGFTPFGGGVSTRTLFETYLRPWREFTSAGGRGVMASHNMVDWSPVHANGALLNGVLRGRFNWSDGFIGSDNTNVEGLATYFRGFASNATDAAAMALAAGVDADMPGGAYLAVASAVRAGDVPIAHVDRAVKHVLIKKFAARLVRLWRSKSVYLRIRPLRC